MNNWGLACDLQFDTQIANHKPDPDFKSHPKLGINDA